MKKIIFVISVVLSVTVLFSIITFHAEKNMKTTDGLNDDSAQHSALKVDDSIKATIGAKDDQTVIRMLIVPIVQAFNAYDSIDEILKSEYLLQTCYIVMNDNEFSSFHQVYEGKIYKIEAEGNVLHDSETRSVLINEDVLKELPKNTNILDVYYLWGVSCRQGSALYYKTNIGDFVYYRCYLTGGTQYLFPVDDFCDIMEKVCENMLSHGESNGCDWGMYIDAIPDISRYDMDSSEFDLGLATENKSVFMRTLPWVCTAALIFGGIATLLGIRKRRKLSKKSL